MLTQSVDNINELTKEQKIYTRLFERYADSVDESMDKLSKKLDAQTMILKNILNVDKEQLEDKSRDDLLKGLIPESPVIDAPDMDPKVIIGGKEQSFFRDFMPDFLGSLAGAMTGVLATGLSLTRVGLGGIVFLLSEPMKEFVIGFVDEIFTQLDPSDIVLSGEGKMALADSLGNALTWGVIGKLIGGKLGLLVGTGGFLYNELGKLIEESDSEIIESLRAELTPEQIAGIGTVLGGVLVFSLPRLLRVALTGSTAVGAALLPSVSKGLTTGIRSAFSLKTMAVGLALGSLFSIASADALQSDEVVNEVSNALSAALVGKILMRTPWGALVGGLTYLAMSGLTYMGDWFKEQENVLQKELEGNLAKNMAKAIREGREYDPSDLKYFGFGRFDMLYDKVNNYLKDKPVGPGPKPAAITAISPDDKDLINGFITEMHALSADNMDPALLEDAETYADMVSTAQRILDLNNMLVKNGGAHIISSADIDILERLIDPERPFTKGIMLDPITVPREDGGQIKNYMNGLDLEKSNYIEDRAVKSKVSPANVVMKGGDNISRGGDTNSTVTNITNNFGGESSIETKRYILRPF